MNEDILIKEITKIVMKKLKELEESNININNIHKKDKDEVVIGISPTFNEEVKTTLSGITHRDVIKEIVAGIEEEGLKARVIKVFKSADVAFIGKEAALNSGSGIGIGLQAKGTSVIHQKDLYPLSNLELFPQAPLIDLKTYRNIGKNSAKYAKMTNPIPIKVTSDCMVRPKFQVKAALFHIKDTEKVIRGAKSVEIPLEELI
ncbi:hypothetical protein JCM1393_26270 [Clostridium carnis]